MKLSGKGTYLFSGVLISIGVLAFFIPDTTTWMHPSEDSITKDIVGMVAIMLGLVTIRLRLAIQQSTSKIRETIRDLQRGDRVD